LPGVDIVYTIGVILRNASHASRSRTDPTIYCAWTYVSMFTRSVLLLALLFIYTCLSFAQQSGQADSSAVAKQGIALAQRGRCTEALPILKKSTSHLTDKQLKYHSAMATARCAMSLEQTEVAVNALLLLKREFP